MVPDHRACRSVPRDRRRRWLVTQGNDDWSQPDEVSTDPAPYEVPADVLPVGEVYDWYVRGVELLEGGNAAAAVQLLSHASDAEPASRSVRESLARAQFDAGMYAEAKESFAMIIEVNPTDDYAQFGMGLAAAKAGQLREAVEHLALAAAMRPDITHYATALRGARAALSAQR